MLALLEFSNAILCIFFLWRLVFYLWAIGLPPAHLGQVGGMRGREGSWARRGRLPLRFVDVRQCRAMVHVSSLIFWAQLCTSPISLSAWWKFSTVPIHWPVCWQTGQPESIGSSPCGPAFSGSCWPGPHPHWGDPPKLLSGRWLEWWSLASSASLCVHSAWLGVLSAGGTAWSRWAGGRAHPAPSNNTVLIEGVYDIDDNNSRGFYFALINTFRLLNEPRG